MAYTWDTNAERCVNAGRTKLADGQFSNFQIVLCVRETEAISHGLFDEDRFKFFGSHFDGSILIDQPVGNHETQATFFPNQGSLHPCMEPQWMRAFRPTIRPR